MHFLQKMFAVGAVAASFAAVASPAPATPLGGFTAVPSSRTASAASDLTEVQYRRRSYRRNNVGGAVAAGAAIGIIGGIIASQAQPRYRYYEPVPVYRAPAYGGDVHAYCFSRYKSYDPYSGTYLGYDGYRHPCP